MPSGERDGAIAGEGKVGSGWIVCGTSAQFIVASLPISSSVTGTGYQACPKFSQDALGTVHPMNENVEEQVEEQEERTMARPPKLSLCTCVALLLVGCKQQEHSQSPAAPQPAAAMKAAPATPIEEKKEELGGKTWDPQWDVLVEQALPADLLSDQAARAVRSYCPNFAHEAEADKRAFWAYLFQALAGAEAGLDPTSNVRHTEPAVAKMDSVTKRTVRQEGLLQLTYQDAARYDCSFDWESDRKLPEHDPNRTILQPAKNLACGIKIMENQIITQGKPMISRTSYWSTLQPGTVSYRVFAKQMANVPEACRVAARRKPGLEH